MKKLQPLHDRVLVKRINIEEKTEGGIFLPDSAKENPLEGEIIAVGPGKIVNNARVPLDIKVGDKVLFAKYAETEVDIEGEKFLLLKEDDLLGIIG